MSAPQSSALYAGTVMHRRLRPRPHALRYRVFSLLLDIDELAALDRRLRWFSVDRFNLFSLHVRDYGDGSGDSLREQAEQRLRAAGLAAGGPIRLLTMPRILGYAFNPLNVWFCHAPGGALQALIYEVNNTFGERHSYLIPVADAQAPVVEQHCEKRMYVSPFLPMDLRYRFRIEPPAAALSVGIGVDDSEGPLLFARLQARRRELGDAALLRVFLTHPLLTLKVIGGIHWEALWLWLKRIPLQPRQPAVGGHSTSVVPQERP